MNECVPQPAALPHVEWLERGTFSLSGSGIPLTLGVVSCSPANPLEATFRLPDGLVAVPREKLEQITYAIFSRHHDAKENGDAYEVGYLGAMLEDLEAMLAAAPAGEGVSRG